MGKNPTNTKIIDKVTINVKVKLALYNLLLSAILACSRINTALILPGMADTIKLLMVIIMINTPKSSLFNLLIKKGFIKSLSMPYRIKKATK